MHHVFITPTNIHTYKHSEFFSRIIKCLNIHYMCVALSCPRINMHRSVAPSDRKSHTTVQVHRLSNSSHELHDVVRHTYVFF